MWPKRAETGSSTLPQLDGVPRGLASAWLSGERAPWPNVLNDTASPGARTTEKFHTLTKKGHELKAIAQALTRTEVSVKERAKLDKVPMAKLR
jgi:hypothetical protein